MSTFVVFGASSSIPLLHGVQRYGLEYMLQYAGLKWYLLELTFYGSGVGLYAVCLRIYRVIPLTNENHVTVPPAGAFSTGYIWHMGKLAPDFSCFHLVCNVHTRGRSPTRLHDESYTRCVLASGRQPSKLKRYRRLATLASLYRPDYATVNSSMSLKGLSDTKGIAKSFTRATEKLGEDIITG